MEEYSFPDRKDGGTLVTKLPVSRNEVIDEVLAFINNEIEEWKKMKNFPDEVVLLEALAGDIGDMKDK